MLLTGMRVGPIRKYCGAVMLCLADQTWGVPDCDPLWQEEFNELNPSVWNVIEGDGCDIGLCGWGNNELQAYDAPSIQIADGLLRITASVAQDGSVRSGKITTAGNYAQQFGRIETRVRLPEGRGLWPAFWMMPEDQHFRWPLEGEIDILEWTGHQPNRAIGAIHFGELPPGNVHYSETLRRADSLAGEFHTVGILWTPQRIAWYVDDQIHSVVTPERIAPWSWVFDDKSFYLILNMAVGGTLGGELVPEDLPATVEFDWVRVYSAACSDHLSLDAVFAPTLD